MKNLDNELYLKIYTFGDAIKALKEEKKVAREGWNGKGMYLSLVKPEHILMNSRVDKELRLSPWIGMKTADNCFVPWLASQTDVLSEDWNEVLDK
jgi:hypothetical protein